MVSPHAALYRRWRSQASIQTAETLSAFVQGVLTDCLHLYGGQLPAHAAAACAIAALSAFENATTPISYDAALAVLDEVKAHWIDGK